MLKCNYAIRVALKIIELRLTDTVPLVNEADAKA